MQEARIEETRFYLIYAVSQRRNDALYSKNIVRPEQCSFTGLQTRPTLSQLHQVYQVMLLYPSCTTAIMVRRE